MDKFVRLAVFLLGTFGMSVSTQATGIPAGSSTSMPAPRLHLVGDSTMADKTNLHYPERGWGQLLRAFMLPELSIINHAANGRSTLRFLNEGRWQLLVSDLAEGDYVLIQFGHNDQKQDDPAALRRRRFDLPTAAAPFYQRSAQQRRDTDAGVFDLPAQF